MALDSRSDFLLQLRERAVWRMRQDEAAAGVAEPAVMSRRSSLRMMGLAAAGVAAGALSARAAAFGSLRSAAPQYGAPTWPGPGMAYERPPKLPEGYNGVPVVSDLETLAKPSSWREDAISVLPEDGRRYSGYELDRRKSKAIYYMAPDEKPHALDAVEDHTTGYTYIVPGGQTFYVRDKDDLLGFLFGPMTLSIRKPIFRIKTESADIDEAIRKVVSRVSAKRLAGEDVDRVEIDLKTTLPRDEWSFSPGWMPPLITVSASGHVLEFEVRGLPKMRVDWVEKKVSQVKEVGG